jgi:hypothetical protein
MIKADLLSAKSQYYWLCLVAWQHTTKAVQSSWKAVAFYQTVAAAARRTSKPSGSTRVLLLWWLAFGCTWNAWNTAW